MNAKITTTPREFAEAMRAAGVADARIENIGGGPGGSLQPTGTLPDGLTVDVGMADDGDFSDPDTPFARDLHAEAHDDSYDQFQFAEGPAGDVLAAIKNWVDAHDGHVSCTPEGCIVR
jgi:hypothetical protein